MPAEREKDDRGGKLAFRRKIILSRSGLHWGKYFREQKQLSRSFFREQGSPLFVCFLLGVLIRLKRSQLTDFACFR